MREVEKLIEELNRKWERRMEQQEKLFQQCYDELLKEYERLKAEVKKEQIPAKAAGIPSFLVFFTPSAFSVRSLRRSAEAFPKKPEAGSLKQQRAL